MRSELCDLQIDKHDELDKLKRELQEMREELEATTRGTLALYNEIDNKNAVLQRQQKELQRKNEALACALSDLKRSEDQRILSERNAAIGNVVVTYNHEINNPLAIIITSLDLLNMSEDTAEAETDIHLDRIRRAAERIRDVISKIKHYENLLPKTYINWDMLDLEMDEVGIQRYHV